MNYFILPPCPKAGTAIPGHITHLMNLAGQARIQRRNSEAAHVLEQGLLGAIKEQEGRWRSPVLVIQLFALYRDNRELLSTRNNRPLTPAEQDELGTIFNFARETVETLRERTEEEERKKLQRSGFDGVAALSACITELAAEFEASIAQPIPKASPVLPDPIRPPVIPTAPIQRAEPLEVRTISAQGLLASIRGLLANKRFKEALGPLLEAIKLEPDNSEAQTGLNACASGFLADAERELSTAYPKEKAVGTFLERYRQSRPDDLDLVERFRSAVVQYEALIRRSRPESFSPPPPPVATPEFIPSPEPVRTPRPILTHDEKDRRQQVDRLLREAERLISIPAQALGKLLVARALDSDHPIVLLELERIFARHKEIALRPTSDARAILHACQQALRIHSNDAEIVALQARIQAATTAAKPTAQETQKKPRGRRPRQTETPEAKRARLFGLARDAVARGDLAGATLIFNALLNLPGDNEPILAFLSNRSSTLDPNVLSPQNYLNAVFTYAEMLVTERQTIPVLCRQLAVFYDSFPRGRARDALEGARRRNVQRIALIEFIQRPENRYASLPILRPREIPLPGLDKQAHFGSLISGPCEYVVFHGLSQLKVAAGIYSDPEIARSIIAEIKTETAAALVIKKE